MNGLYNGCGRRLDVDSEPSIIAGRDVICFLVASPLYITVGLDRVGWRQLNPCACWWLIW